jgi:hypothetical protein
MLKDVADGKYDGFPQAGVRMVSLQSPAYREYLKLPMNNLGARIDTMLPIGSTRKVLKAEDVILKIGDFPVASDSTILYEGNRVSAGMALHQAQQGDKVPLEIWRGGEKIELALPMYVFSGDDALGYQPDKLPRYYVYGGLVFTPVSLDYLRSLNRDVNEPGVADLFYELRFRRYESPETARSEPVVLAAVLPDAVNANVLARGRDILDRVNGRRIDKLEDVITAFETNTNAFDVIEFIPRDQQEVLERADVATANPRILKTYSISKDRRL